MKPSCAGTPTRYLPPGEGKHPVKPGDASNLPQRPARAAIRPGRFSRSAALKSHVHSLFRHLDRIAVILLLASACLHAANGAAGDMVFLQESGHFSGSGYHEIAASGPLCNITILPGNESLLKAGNGSIWRVMQNGSLREVI